MKPPDLYTPARALVELAAQHDTLRGLMDRCEEIADAVDAGDAGPMQLTREVARLRIAFDVHNRFEEELLRPVLLAGDAFGEVRIDRMVEDHVGEHHAMRTRLGSSATAELRAVIESLRAHLDSEERYFLTAKVLRDDIVTVEGSG
ncbi:MAG TPA: hemerythrin domain-containing protein [Kofleriaceae bacterium]|nr:hemerythrin domain-containing protein [Kofleriaceae bacterium]